jgi:hypothetical protein
MKKCKRHKWVIVRAADRPRMCSACGYWPKPGQPGFKKPDPEQGG